MDRLNRSLWTLLALLLLALGAAGALAAADVLPVPNSDTTLLWSGLLESWRAEPHLARWIGIGTGLGLAVAGALLVWVQLAGRGGRRLPDPRWEARTGAGQTRVSVPALADAFGRDLQSIPGVRAAAVRLTGSAERLSMHARIAVAAGVDLDTLAEQVARRLETFTATTGLTPTELEVTLSLDERPPARVQ